MTWAAVSPGSIVLTNGKLSVKLRQASFNDVVKIISEKTGTDIYIFDDTDNHFITTEFECRSLEFGLRSIFKEVNYAIVYKNGLKKGDVKWMNDAARNSTHGRLISRQSADINKKKTYSNNKISNYRSSGKTVAVSQMESTSSKSGLTGETDDDSGTEDNSSDNYYSSYGSSGSSTSSDSETSEEESSQDSSEETYSESDDDIPSWYYDGISQEEAKLRYRIDVLEGQIESGYADMHYDHWVKVRGPKIVRHAEELIQEYEDKLADITAQ